MNPNFGNLKFWHDKFLEVLKAKLRLNAFIMLLVF
jgi:hypothetical protein